VPILRPVASGGGEAQKLASGVVGLLTALCRELTDVPGAGGCVVSRAIGDVLVEVAESTPEGRKLQLGHGYLVSDYPETQAAIETGTPRIVSLSDENVDPGEAKLLRELDFEAVLMVPLATRDGIWGLVEVYRGAGTPFSEADAAVAVQTVGRFARLLEDVLS
jgi:GAF domain-containing protein